jgi:hypothetical protein
MDSYSIRADYYVTSKANAFFRFVDSPSNSTLRGMGNATSQWIAKPGWNSYTAGDVYIFSPKLVNDFRFNYSEATGFAYSKLDAIAGSVPISDTDPLVFPKVDIPGISPLTPANTRFFITYSPGTSWRDGLETDNAARQWNYVDSVSVTSGSHQMKFGVDFRRLTPIQVRAPYQQSYTFTTTASMNKGVANTYLSLINPYTVGLNHNLSLYAQDAWKVRPKLTLTYGLRWEYNPAPGTLNNVPDIAFTQLDYNNLAGTQVAPLGTPIYKNQWNALAPRVGVAYQASAKPGWARVIRGGFGLFFDTTGDFAQNSTVNGASASLSNVTVPATLIQENPLNINPNPNQAPWPVITTTPPNFRMPHTWQMSAAIEQELGKFESFTVTYAGAIGRGLFLQQDLRAAQRHAPAGLRRDHQRRHVGLPLAASAVAAAPVEWAPGNGLLCLVEVPR